MAIKQNTDAPYWGLIEQNQERSGRYADYSLVCFPPSSRAGKLLVVLIVGSDGFSADLTPSASPYWRRRFQDLIIKERETLREISEKDRAAYWGEPLPYKDVCPLPETGYFIKSNFQDITSEMPRAFLEPLDKNANAVFGKYGTVLLAGVWLDFRNAFKESNEVMSQWIATYSDIRGLMTTKGQRSNYERVMKALGGGAQNTVGEVEALLDKRRFVVLQGAPGVGKTHTAKMVSKAGGRYGKTFFIQFHGATTYSDFVSGIRPRLGGEAGARGGLQFEETKGKLQQAIEWAAGHPGERVLLIIDEINRANLANVLGPVFYLFEPQEGVEGNFEVEVGSKRYGKLPENLDVLATMNTADRSLAVVDFALRRRFAWYTIAPAPYTPGEGRTFMTAAFERMAQIFQRYASDMELDLQPGPSYFDVEGSDEGGGQAISAFEDKLRYELMPLIKEYLEQGYMTAARTAFINYFLEYRLIMER